MLIIFRLQHHVNLFRMISTIYGLGQGNMKKVSECAELFADADFTSEV